MRFQPPWIWKALRARTSFLHAYLNATYETGFTNPIDEAIRTHRSFDLSGYQKRTRFPMIFFGSG